MDNRGPGRDVAKRIRSWFLRAGYTVIGSPIIPSTLVAGALGWLGGIQARGFERQAYPVSMAAFPSGSRGALCFSVDFDHPHRRGMDRRLLSDGTKALVELSEKYRIPLTWAICVQTAREEPELLREILLSKARKEIAFHTYSHLDLSDPSIGQERLREDFSQGIKHLEEFGKPNCFVFPFNREGHYDILTEFGFASYRGSEGGHKLMYPSIRNDLWDIHASYYVRESEPFAFVPKTLLRLAVRFGSVAHLWTHPWSVQVSGDTDKFTRRVLEPTFELASKMRDEGSLWTATMQEITSYCETRFRASVEEVDIQKGKIRFVSRLYRPESARLMPGDITFKILFPKASRHYEVMVDGLLYAQASASHTSFHETFLSTRLSDAAKVVEIDLY